MAIVKVGLVQMTCSADVHANKTKAIDKIKNIVGVGTVIEGPSEYKNARLTKHERKTTIVDEILHDNSVKSYSKRVYAELQDRNSNYKKTYKDKRLIQEN